jgi:hypothetical protein
MSGRVANCQCYIELVEVDDNGNVILDTEISASPSFEDARS